MCKIIFLLFRHTFPSETANLHDYSLGFRTAEFLLDVSNTDDEYYFFAASLITMDGTPLKFVSTGNVTSADRLTFCWPIRNPFCYMPKADAVSKISRGWLQAVFLTAFTPLPIPHRFLFGPWISCCAAESLTPRPRQWKTHPKKWTAMQAKQSQSLFKFFIRNCQAQLFKRWIVLPTEQITIHWITHTNIIIICFPILIHWIVISLADSAIHLLNDEALGLYLWDLKRKHQSERLLHLV